MMALLTESMRVKMSLYTLSTLFIGTLPFQMFFVPTPKFRKWVAVQAKKIIDCGAGVGLLSSFFPDKVVGIDLHEREVYKGKVYVGMDATTFPFTSDHLALIARPDGSGWMHETTKNALENGAEVVYVGLSKNYERDLEPYEHSLLIDKAGMEGEQAWQLVSVL